MVLPAYIDGSTGEITDGEAWVAISTATVVGTSTTTITFTSTNDGQVGDFSQYMDLVVVASLGAIVDSTYGNFFYYNLNNDTTDANYHIAYASGNGSSASASAHAWKLVGYMPGSHVDVANVMTVAVMRWFDINSGKFKAMVSLTGMQQEARDPYVAYINNVWKSQAPITEIDLFEPNGNEFKEDSMFSLFGVLPRMVA